MPTENRSTPEMVSVPRELLERLDLGKNTATALSALPELRAILGKPAQQHQGEPVGTLLIGEYFDNREVGEVDVQLDSTVCEQLAAKYPGQSMPIYTHADPAEVERLRDALKFYADREHFHFESGNWDTVSGEPLNILWCGDEPDFIEDGSVARAALERKP